ncbi:MAG: hypothetical protein AB7F22_00315 [Reyranella sp.]|uniref:hypothetical protein n=1 Tax=Reyranella sp. TaxID=1929291 RepID=UPI003D0A4439
MSRAVLLAAALAGAALVGGCASEVVPTENKSAEQMAKDEAQCRAQVRSVAQSERNIEDQRRAVFEGERERFGQQDLYNTMANQGYKRNVDRLTARCMEARGWAPRNKTLWQRLGL